MIGKAGTHEKAFEKFSADADESKKDNNGKIAQSDESLKTENQSEPVSEAKVEEQTQIPKENLEENK